MQPMNIKETKVPSFGEQLFEVNVDTPAEDKVTKVNQMFAELAEILKNDYQSNNRHPLKSLLFDHAVGEMVSAQMAIVKILTMKHYTENENTQREQDSNQ
jgi:hypothetical protein